MEEALRICMILYWNEEYERETDLTVSASAKLQHHTFPRQKYQPSKVFFFKADC